MNGNLPKRTNGVTENHWAPYCPIDALQHNYTLYSCQYQIDGFPWLNESCFGIKKGGYGKIEGTRYP